MPQTVCADARRRQDVRNRGRNGIDYVEVGRDQVSLTVVFFGRAPEQIHARNFSIEALPGARPVLVKEARHCRVDDPEREDCVRVFVNQPGDFSPYTLRVRDLEGFDERFTSGTFRFHNDAAAELDCHTDAVCLAALPPVPEIDYSAKDYESFRQLILDRLSLTMPDWNEQHVPDIGIALVEVLAYTADYLSYFQDAVATEAYLSTARKRISVRRHARMVDYRVHEGCNARVWITLETGADFSVESRNLFFTTAIGTLIGSGPGLLGEAALAAVPPASYEVFEPIASGDLHFRDSFNTIHFYTWGDFACCLPAGATSATLIDSWKDPGDTAVSADGKRALEDLKAGDCLLFEEVFGPETGAAADADPKKRQIVRLTHVRRHVDDLFDQPVVEIAWSVEDALAFPLCLSTITPAPERRHIKHVSVARGNVVLADNGRTLDAEEDIGSVNIDGSLFRPQLKQQSITWRRPPLRTSPATSALSQDPRAAVPQILELTSSTPAGSGGPLRPIRWIAKEDLLESGANDADFVVEVDDDGNATLRFGDGTIGLAPPAGSAFKAKYRTGNGTQGNVGAESIVSLFTRGDVIDGLKVSVRNPMAAAGGTEPEDVATVKLLAPDAFRSHLQRAVTAEDYATLAENNPAVQRAAATLLWTGTRYLVRVSIDPLGSDQPDPQLLESIRQSLSPYRRIGHDVQVESARYVPLFIAIAVTVAPDYVRGHVEAAVLDALSDRVLADGARGFFHPDRLSFGDNIYVSRLIAAVQGIAGVVTVLVTRLERLLAGAQGEIASGALNVGPLEVARLDSDPSHPENGVLRLTMRGGR